MCASRQGAVPRHEKRCLPPDRVEEWDSGGQHGGERMSAAGRDVGASPRSAGRMVGVRAGGVDRDGLRADRGAVRTGTLGAAALSVHSPGGAGGGGAGLAVVATARCPVARRGGLGMVGRGAAGGSCWPPGSRW